MNTVKQYDILGFGMPTTDYILEYNDSPVIGDEIRQKFKYQMQNEDSSLLDRIYSSNKVQKNMGGSTLNTIRIVNKIFHRNKAYFIGSIGNDKNAEFIRQQLANEGIQYDLNSSLNKNTSTVIALIEKKDRQLFANIGSSSDLSVDLFKKNHEHLKHSRVIYSDGYLVNYIYDSYAYVYSSFSNDDNNLLGMGFADPQVLLDYYPKMSKVIPYCDILFMNKKEFKTWATVTNYDDKDIDPQLLNDGFEEYIMKFLNKKALEKHNKKKAFIVVITQGKKDAIVYWNDYQHANGFIIKEPKWKYDEVSVVDTTGVGDSFAGGFLAGMILGKQYNECAMIGHYTAAKVLMVKGFQVPDISIEKIEAVLQKSKLESNQSKKDDL